MKPVRKYEGTSHGQEMEPETGFGPKQATNVPARDCTSHTHIRGGEAKRELAACGRPPHAFLRRRN